MRQGVFEFPERRRVRRIRRRTEVPHTTREEVDGVVHVNVKLCKGLPSLRTKKTLELLEECFRQAKARFDCELLHFAILSNHVHLLVFTKRAVDLSRFMQEFKHKFSTWFNHRHGRRGTLWEERFKSVLTEVLRQDGESFDPELLKGFVAAMKAQRKDAE